MRLGLVERGNYKTTDYDDLTGYQLEVNGFTYNFGEIIEETRYRVPQLWGFECPPGLLRARLHFSEEKYFNRMVKNEHYGIFSRHTGAHVCLGLVSEAETYNLVIHEVAHEIHYRQGYYEGADEIVQEAVAIMAEEEYAVREFDWNPHYTAQQLLHQLYDLPGFGPLPFHERWSLLSKLRTSQQISHLINHYLDEADGGPFRDWLARRLPTPEAARSVLNVVATATEKYALYNRRLLLARLRQIEGVAPLTSAQCLALTRAVIELKRLDTIKPQESLTNLMELAFAGLR